MSVTSGFFNALEGTEDRLYSAEQMSSLFDGIILDGIFASIGDALIPKATGTNTVNIGTGKAWFNHTWTLNDAILPIEMPEADSLRNRIDAIVLDVNSEEAVRNNEFKIVSGEPSEVPSRPVMIDTKRHHQHALVYIYRKAGSISINERDMTITIGTTETPFITSVLKTISIDELLGRWQDELNQFVALKETEMDEFMNAQYLEYQAWFRQVKDDFLHEQQLFEDWQNSQKESFIVWFNEMKGKLGTDAAGNLQLQIDRDRIDDVFRSGFIDGTKTFSDDGTAITSLAADGRKLVKTFTNNFNTITSVLYTKELAEVATQVKEFSPDGKLINLTVTYI